MAAELNELNLEQPDVTIYQPGRGNTFMTHTPNPEEFSFEERLQQLQQNKQAAKETIARLTQAQQVTNFEFSQSMELLAQKAQRWVEDQAAHRAAMQQMQADINHLWENAADKRPLPQQLDELRNQMAGLSQRIDAMQVEITQLRSENHRLRGLLEQHLS